jgi:phage terminase large subunit GpA-like protein
MPRDVTIFPSDVVLPNADVLFVTRGVDVQLRYLAWLDVGWTLAGEPHALDFGTIDGSPHDGATWEALRVETLGTEYRDADDGRLPIHLVGIDSGYAPEKVNNFCAGLMREVSRLTGWFATRGEQGERGKPIVIDDDHHRRAGVSRSAYRPIRVNTDAAKSWLMETLALTPPAAGAWRFSRKLLAMPGFVVGLTAEERKPIFNVDDVEVGYRWIKTRERNEALDCAVICIALWHYISDRELVDTVLTTRLKGDRDAARRAWVRCYPNKRRFM